MSAAPRDTRIRHTVAFALRHPAGSAAEVDFLRAAERLATIPGVQDFTRLRQVSPENDYTFMFEMTFADEDAYQAYNEHPAHRTFVAERWESEVTTFVEIDLIDLALPANPDESGTSQIQAGRARPTERIDP